MAKQTFTTGQVLTAAQMTTLQQTAMLGGAANAKTASYVLVAADAGDAITMSNASPTTITVNTGLFAAGDIVTIINLGAGATTITAGTATVATSGSLVLATNQGGVLRFTSASAAIFFQFATPASGDIEGVTAGTGISGGGTSGTVTITNSMATAIDAKGDLVVGTGADTFSRLAVGTNGYTLVANSSTATGLEWQAPASGGGMTSIASGSTTSGQALNLGSISGAYEDLRLVFRKMRFSGNAALDMYPNGSFATNKGYTATYNTAGSVSSSGSTASNRWPVTAGQANSSADMVLVLDIYDYANTTAQKQARYSVFYMDNSSVLNQIFYNAVFKVNDAITSIYFDISNGPSFDSGTYELFGVK